MFQFPKLLALKGYLDSLHGKVDLNTLGQLLNECDVQAHDVDAACIFSDDHYARNKIACSDWYDLLILCWKPGQTSAIHDHAGSSCGFKILKGIASEVVYRKTGSSEKSVVPISTREYQLGTICLAQDNDIHRISNESTSEDLITMHCYSPALHMNNYTLDPSLRLPDSGRVSDILAFLAAKH